MTDNWDASAQLDRYRTVMHQAKQTSGIELERRKTPRPANGGQPVSNPDAQQSMLKAVKVGLLDILDYEKRIRIQESLKPVQRKLRALILSSQSKGR